ncbi:MAG: hypothetical protein L6W00_28655 [Lentisphaeria bacterium]|nr:MAG: hypothetical protein L6W00_28655 [Lentisphaeria bacterium]
MSYCSCSAVMCSIATAVSGRASISAKPKRPSRARDRSVQSLIGRYLRPWVLRLSQLGQLHADLPLFPGRVPGRSLTRQQVYYLYTSAFRELGLRRFGTHSPRKTWATQTYCYWLDQQRKGAQRRSSP